MEDNLTTKQVAEALKVSESSIKRWCDRGLIQTKKTFGGHRRIPMDALMTFLAESDREVVDPAPIGMTQSSYEVDGNEQSLEPAEYTSTELEMKDLFENAMIRGDDSECRRIAINWYSNHESFALLSDRLIAPTFKQLGKLWTCGAIEIFQERRGVQICSRLVHEFRRLIAEPPTQSPLAIGGSGTGDNYVLCGQIVEVVLRESGWRAVNIGTNLPLETLAAAVNRESPQLVWLSVSFIDNEASFLKEYRAFINAIPSNIFVVVGGRALSDSIRPKMQFGAFCDRMQQLGHIARLMKPNTSVAPAAF